MDKKSIGQFVQPFFPSYTVNWNKTVWQNYIANYRWHQQSASWGWFKQDSIGYIAVSSWNKDEVLLQDFDAGMTKLPNCISIGDTTGGGLSNGRQFSLSNGTIYTLSDQLIYDTDKKIVESAGIPPQVVVNWNINNVNNGKDPVLDYALNLLKNK